MERKREQGGILEGVAELFDLLLELVILLTHVHEIEIAVPRAHDRILRVARTVADLAGKQLLDEDCVLEALQYRAQEKVEV